MGMYLYKGIQTNEKSKCGIIAAGSAKEAIGLLAEMAVLTPKLKYIGSLNGLENKLFVCERLKRLKKKDIAYLFTQMSFLLKAGITTFEAIEVLGVSVNINIAKLCMSMKPMIIQGMSLADALDSTKLLPCDIIEKVRAGETSNSMEEALANIATKLKEELELISNIKGGLTYPVFSIVAVFAIAMVMLIFLVPQIASIVSDFGVELPTITKALIKASDFVRGYWIHAIVAVLVMVFAHMKMMNKSSKYKLLVDRKIYDIPVIGNIIRKVNLLYFCSVLSQLMNNGKNTADSIELAKKTIKNSYFYNTLKEVEFNIVRKGMDLYSAMATHSIFPNEFLQMIMIGVRTGNVSEVLNNMYNEYRYETKDEIKAATDLIQPISLILIGIITGVFVMGMYSALYCIIDAV